MFTNRIVSRLVVRLPKNSRSVVSASLVKELRDKSGAPMMDCKKALAAPDVNGDIAKAIDWLRAKGIARASSQTDRVANEGLIAVKSSSSFITLLEVNSETDFVSMNKDFQKFVAMISETISNNLSKSGAVDIDELLKTKPVNGANTVRDALGDVISVIRENIVIKRAENIYPQADGVLATYVHGKVNVDGVEPTIQLGKTASIISFNIEKTEKHQEVANIVANELGRKLAMHIVAAKPLYLNESEVPRDVIDKEIEIFREQTKDDNKNKKPEVVDKIIQGKVTKRLGELCLLGQAHVAEEGSPIIKKFLDTFSTSNKTKVSVERFQRWTLGQK